MITKFGGISLEDSCFDVPVDRYGSGCSKWEALEATHPVRPPNGLAMWIADMDFHPPRAVTDALAKMLKHNVFGYIGSLHSYQTSIADWMNRRHGWEVDPDSILTTHGVVHGLATCIQTFTNPRDGVIIFTPVYHVFARLIAANNRQPVESPLTIRNGQYEMDLDRLEASLTGHERMVILCSPHNPGGRVWSSSEIIKLRLFCERHRLFLVSDEIHHDLVHPDYHHTVAALAEGGSPDRLVVLTAATKTFNIAACQIGNIIAPAPHIRDALRERLEASDIAPNAFGVHMTEAAYNLGERWLCELIRYLDGNKTLFEQSLADIPGVIPMHLQSTYLSWVDFSQTGLSPSEIEGRVDRSANIVASVGRSFGVGGETFLRFNLACPRASGADAAERIKNCFT